MIDIIEEQDFIDNPQRVLNNAKNKISSLIKDEDGNITTILTHHESFTELLAQEILKLYGK
jgi:hypothetical protein